MNTFGQPDFHQQAHQQAQQAAQRLQQLQQRQQKQLDQLRRRQMAGYWRWLQQQRWQPWSRSRITQLHASDQDHQPSLRLRHRRDWLPLAKTNLLPDRSRAPMRVRKEGGGCARILGLGITLLAIAVPALVVVPLFA
ncbi:MAG: hypothetical protein E3J21_06350 [Anaerolineales bacterium]|nr:MAG: hypothetical protein E3J21_06350 [Anaerolineales bacterium]